MMDFGAGLADISSPPLIGWIIDNTGSWDGAFLFIIGLLVLGALLSAFLRPDKPFLWSRASQWSMLGQGTVASMWRTS